MLGKVKIQDLSRILAKEEAEFTKQLSADRSVYQAMFKKVK